MRRKVKRIIDGDTFETCRKINGSNRVRLAGVNAPDSGRAKTKATNVLKGMIGGRTVGVKPVGRSYGRTVAKVKSNRRSVNKRMKQKGY